MLIWIKRVTSLLPGLQGMFKMFLHFFSGVLWYDVSLYNRKHCNWLHVMSSHWWSWPCFKHESFYQAENIAALLLICTKEQQSSLAHFLWEKGAKSAKMCTPLCAEYRSNAFSQTSLCRWIDMLKKGWKTDWCWCSGCPTSARGENLKGFRTIVLKHRRVTITEIIQ